MNRNVLGKRVADFLPLSALLAGLAFYVYYSLFAYAAAGRDDTFITFWSGISLAEGHGLVNYNFEPAEMSSSLFHTLLVAAIHLLEPDFIYTLNKATGFIAGAFLLVVLYRNRELLFGRERGDAILFALTVLGLATNRAWLYWNMGGLETPFQTVILFLYGLSLIRWTQSPSRVLPLMVFQILYILVRPEGFLLVLLTGFYLALRTKFHRPLGRKQLLLLVGVPSLVFLSILVVRYIHFGLLFPTPVYAKVYLRFDANLLSKLKAGLQYLGGFYSASPYNFIQFLILVAAVVHFTRILLLKVDLPFLAGWKPGTGNGSARFNNSVEPEPAPLTTEMKFILWIGLILANHLFVIATGGDWMEYYRFIVPVIPFLTILTACFAFRMCQAAIRKNSSSRPALHAYANGALGILFLIAIMTNSGQRDNPATSNFHNCSERFSLSKLHSLALAPSHLDENLILSNCAGKRDWEAVMPFITDELPKIYEASHHRVTIATFQMGFFPYYVRKLHPAWNITFIDTLGLGDRTIARMQGRRASYGLWEGTRIVYIFAGMSGELSEYVLNRDPNMIYVLEATPFRRTEMSRLGWTTSWDQPGAVIFTKTNEQNSKTP